jgi:hypothetical protein
MLACHAGGMTMSTGDLYRLAGDLAAEHGPAASDYASRAVMTLEAEGNHARAKFWFVIMVMLGDIHTGRVDPEGHITIH